MAELNVVAGDFASGKYHVFFDQLSVRSKKSKRPESIDLARELANIELITDENKKVIGGTLVGGLAGLALLGPLGAVGGMLVGGNRKTVSFVMILKDSRRIMGQSNVQTFMQLQGLITLDSGVSSSTVVHEERDCGIFVDYELAEPASYENSDQHETVDSNSYVMGIPRDLFEEYIALSEDEESLQRASAMHTALVENYPDSELAKQDNKISEEASIRQKIYLEIDERMTANLSQEELEEYHANESARLEAKQSRADADFDRAVTLPMGIPKYLFDQIMEIDNSNMDGVRESENLEDIAVRDYPNSEFADQVRSTRTRNGGRHTEPKSKRPRRGIFKRLIG